MKHRMAVIQNLFAFGFLFWLALAVNAAQNSAIRVTLGEPSSGGIYAGISNLRGWAIAPYGIDKVELYIDGVYMYDIPYGGARKDIGNAFPGYPDADYSGFSMAFNYKNLTPGLHTFTARAIDMNGDYNDSTATFSALRFNSTFIADTKSVDVSQISAFEALDNNRFKLSGIEVEGSKWNLVIGWNRASQGFEIEQISPIDNALATFSVVGNWSGSYTVSGAGESCTYNLSLTLYRNGTGNVYSSLVSDNSPSLNCVSSTGDLTWTFDGSHLPVYVTNSSAFIIGGNSFNFSVDIQTDAVKLVDSSNWYGVKITRRATLYRK